MNQKENLILNAEEKLNNLEYEIFCNIKDEIKKHISKLQQVSSQIAFYDVMQSFATIAEEKNFIKPTINDEGIVNIISGRHPVVESVIDGEYIDNDIILDKLTNILIITGPNMSGKSTYMREFGIIAILNQIGSFVPAKKCNIPIFDKIFTRIGASDDLVSGESTFMVEMKEANYAISNATENSLILFDELGRGTSTYDGMSLAGSIIEYISKNINFKYEDLFFSDKQKEEFELFFKIIVDELSFYAKKKGIDNKIKFVSCGKTSLIYVIGDKIIKIGKPRRCSFIPYCIVLNI